MKVINVYDKFGAQLTTFTDVDYTSLSHKRSLGEIGDCSFVLNLGASKINATNLNHYNRIKIFDDGALVFTGLIMQLSMDLNTVKVRCRELPYILKKRVVTANYTMNGTITDVLTALLVAINAVENTGIDIGILAGVGSVNLTFNRTDVWTIIKQVCESTGNQFEITPEGKLNVRNYLGVDRSSTVFFRYDITQLANANIFAFNVDDDGDDIVTLAHGESQGFLSDQTSTALANKYGILETYKDFRVVNTQSVLDQFTLLEVQDRIYSPKINLKPDVADNFKVYDLVRIKIKNSMVNIDSSFQVMEKSVSYQGQQKLITIRINNVPNYLAQQLADRDKRLTLLEKQL